MRLVMLSTDSKVFYGGTVAERIASYGTITVELLFVVFAPGKRKEVVLAPNVRAVSSGGSNRYTALLSGFLLLMSETRKKKYDVLSSQDPFMLGIVGLIVSKLKNIAFQVQLHTDCFSPLYAAESVRRTVESLIARVVIPLASGVRVVSQRTALAVRRLTQKAVVVLPLPFSGVSAGTRARPRECIEGVFTVLTVARFTKEKQLHFLIEAIDLTPDLHLVLVGEGPEKEGLVRLVAEKGLSERVRFAPWQDPAAYYAHADAFALVSRYEGYGLAVMEAALYGLPIVVTDVGVAGYELKDDMDILVVDHTANAIARSLSRLREDSALRETLGASARKKAEGMTVSTEAYLARYRQALMACIQERTYTKHT